MDADDALYRISEVSQRTGLSVPLLRQWERRYGFPAPDRTEGGHRIYSEQEIAQLQRAKAWIDAGVQPARAVERAQGTSELPATREDTAEVDALEAAVLDGHLDQAEAIISRYHQLHPIPVVLLDLVQPVLERIGQRWSEGEILISQEHRASDYLRGKVRSLLDLHPDRGGPAVVTATLPGERHEIGLLIVAVLLSRGGWHVDHLGSDVPLGDLATHARRRGARAIVLSATWPESLFSLRDGALADLADLVVVGGPAAEEHPDEVTRLGGVRLCSDPRELADRLRARLA